MSWKLSWDKSVIPNNFGALKTNCTMKKSLKGQLKRSSSNLLQGITSWIIILIIVLKRLKGWYDKHLLDQPQLCRRGRGTADGIFVCKRLQQISKKNAKNCVSYFFCSKCSIWPRWTDIALWIALSKISSRNLTKTLILVIFDPPPPYVTKRSVSIYPPCVT